MTVNFYYFWRFTQKSVLKNESFSITDSSLLKELEIQRLLIASWCAIIHIFTNIFKRRTMYNKSNYSVQNRKNIKHSGEFYMFLYYAFISFLLFFSTQLKS